MALDPIAKIILGNVDRFMTPDARREFEEWKERADRTPQVPDDDPEALADMKRLLAKPRIRTRGYSDGEGG